MGIEYNADVFRHDTEQGAAERYWLDGRRQVESVHEKGGWQEYADGIPNDESERVFNAEPTCVCCMDERVAFGSGETLDAVYTAGCGILIKDNAEKRRTFIDALKNAGVRDVYSHEECGAVALYAAQNNVPLTQALEEADAWYRELAGELGGTYHAELTVSPEGHHVAHAAYWDTTGGFNPGKVPGLFPPGFVITEPIVGEKHAVEHMDVALGIAFGEHGFGARFTEEHPFEIVIVAGSAAELKRVRALLASSAARYGGAVNIDGFIR